MKLAKQAGVLRNLTQKWRAKHNHSNGDCLDAIDTQFTCEGSSETKIDSLKTFTEQVAMALRVQ